jgi:hypothetical protein
MKVYDFEFLMDMQALKRLLISTGFSIRPDQAYIFFGKVHNTQ